MFWKPLFSISYTPLFSIEIPWQYKTIGKGKIMSYIAYIKVAAGINTHTTPIQYHSHGCVHTMRARCVTRDACRICMYIEDLFPRYSSSFQVLQFPYGGAPSHMRDYNKSCYSLFARERKGFSGDNKTIVPLIVPIIV